MILDGMDNIGRYKGLYKGLDVLIDWLAERDIATLPTGRNEILGNKVFANVQDATTRLYEDAHYEIHRRYMDLQVDLDNHERFAVAPGATVEVTPFEEGRDYGLVDAAEGADEVFDELGSGRFVIFLTTEPHMPNLVAEGAQPAPIRKICFKLLADEYWDE